MRKKISLLFFFLLFLPIAYAPPPSQIFEGSTVDYLELRISELPYIIEGKGYELKIHVFNSSNGLPVYNGVSCYLHLYNDSLKHIAEVKDVTASHDFDYELDIGGNNFSEVGYYPYIAQCNTSSAGGYIANYIEVTKTGRGYTDNMALMAILVLLPLIFMGLLLLGTIFMNDEHAILKITVWLLTPILFFLSFHIGLISVAKFYNFPALQDLIGSSTYWIGIVSGVFLVYFIIYAIYKMIKQAAEDKEGDMEY